MSESFLSRWSKRKLEALEQQGEPVEAPQQQVVPTQAKPEPPAAVEAELPLPTEDDLLAVRQGGDVKAFLVDKVSTELKNKAFKALFSRPEFNVMDGLDIYIDDYNKFTPLSQEDIGKMAFSKQLLSRPDLELPKLDAASDLNRELLDGVAVQTEPQAKTDEPSAEKQADAANITNELEETEPEQIPTEEAVKTPPKEPG